MNKPILKAALLRGIPFGLIIALILILFRTLSVEAGFIQNLASLYGISTLICFPVAFVWIFYNRLDKEEKSDTDN